VAVHPAIVLIQVNELFKQALRQVVEEERTRLPVNASVINDRMRKM
jgi:hypothetical protein